VESNIKPPDIDEDSAEALAAFSEAARDLLSDVTIEDVFVHVVDLAVAAIEGCDFAGIFFVDDGIVTTPAFTDPLVVVIDELQHAHGEGPCLDAMSEDQTFYADDLADETRWARFAPEATSMGVRSLLALPLATGDVMGALNLYARYPRAFGVIDRARAQLLAALASAAFSLAQTHENEDRRAVNFQAGLATREMIGQAQGILMERERISADQAFDVLRRASQHLNRRLREVAQTLVETGERPDTGP